MVVGAKISNITGTVYGSIDLGDEKPFGLASVINMNGSENQAIVALHKSSTNSSAIVSITYIRGSGESLSISKTAFLDTTW